MACAVFFVRQAARVEESPESAQPNREVVLLPQAGTHLLQGDVIRLGDQASQVGLMGIELGAAGSSLGEGRHRPGRRKRGYPTDRCGHTDPEAGRRLPTGGGFGGVDDPFAEVLAVGRPMLGSSSRARSESASGPPVNPRQPIQPNRNRSSASSFRIRHPSGWSGESAVSVWLRSGDHRSG